MKFNISRALYDALKECSELDFRDDYSGRFMFGATCFGIVTDKVATVSRDFQCALHDVIRDYASDESGPDAIADEAAELLNTDIFNNYRQDNMGLSYIVYFPGVTVEPADEEE